MDRACSKHGEKRNACRVSVEKSEGNRPLGRPKRKWENNIKINVREIGWGGTDWIHLAEDREEWRGSCEHGNEPSGFQKILGNS
jgi:hypothetical protein